MNTRPDILDAISNTSKGKLKYDPKWFEDGRIQEVLIECTSPPKLSAYPGSQVTGKSDQNYDGEDSEYDSDNSTTQENGRWTPNNISEGGQTPSYATTEDDLEPMPRSSNQKAHSSPGLNRSDLERQIIIAQKVRQEEEEDIAALAMRNTADRRRLFDQFSKLIQRKTQDQWRQLYADEENKAERVIRHHQRQNKNRMTELLQLQQQLRLEHEQKAQVMSSKMRDAKKQQQENEEQERKRQQEIEDKLLQLENAQKEFLKVKVLVSGTIDRCKNSDLLPEGIRKYPEVMLNLSQQVESILNEVRSSESSAWNVTKLTEYLSKAENILEFVRKHVEQAEKKHQELQAATQQEQDKQQQHQQQQQQQQQQAAREAQQKKDVTTQQASVSGGNGDKRSPNILLGSVFRETLTYCAKMINQQKDVEKSFQTLVSDPRMKKNKFELQKTVNTLINTISSESGHHLREKLDKITCLISGRNVSISTDTVNAKNYEGGMEFCRDLFAKKFVSQGDTQVSSQHDSAFAFASVAVGVWCEVPEVGDLILAHFYINCPYLVPYYVPKKEGQSREDYYKSLGYNYTGGECEKQEKFLKRMSGLMRLYAAIMVSSPPRSNQTHPHGLDKAWHWLAQVICLDPRPDITATILYDFLKVTAHSLLKTYKKQFQKLVEFIMKDFLPRIRSVTMTGSGGPVTRLEGLLEGIIKGQVLLPKGYLDQYFWQT